MPSANEVVSSLVLNVANILLLYVILRLLVYRPVKKYMSARSAGIEADREGAKKQLAEANAFKAECESSLAAVRVTAEAERQRILDAAEIRASEITADAEDEANKIKESAIVKAQHTADQMMKEMQERIADLSVEIAGKLLEREIQKSDNTDIIEKYFNRVG
jgi:F-type H+-transporting ATPase subunit b